MKDSHSEQAEWVEEHLQVIRTLMERVMVYRRALAPVSLFVGAMGLAGALVGIWCGWETGRAFLWLWLVIGVVTGVGAAVLIRLQAWRAKEPFWSPPTRRVAQASAPPWFCGVAVTILLLIGTGRVLPPDTTAIVAPFLWAMIYGLGLSAAGFFMRRGIRWLGWVYVVLGTISAAIWVVSGRFPLSPNQLMAVMFGGVHLLYGVYLALTDRRNHT